LLLVEEVVVPAALQVQLAVLEVEVLEECWLVLYRLVPAPTMSLLDAEELVTPQTHPLEKTELHLLFQELTQLVAAVVAPNCKTLAMEAQVEAAVIEQLVAAV
jgi:hypothetical protein